MRIISGHLKGRKINPPRKLPVRPTTDMAKEGLFNILNNRYYFDELEVLDLFAGSGNISFEFGSRGCESITAVDKNPLSMRFISSTSEELELNIQTVKSDVFKYLENSGAKFDIIFADPPYNFDLLMFEEIHALVFKNELIRPEGLLIIEHSKHTDLKHLEHFERLASYGGSVFSFFSFQ